MIYSYIEVKDTKCKFGTTCASLLVHHKEMIYKIRKGFNNIDELTQFIETGVLFVHRKESGTYLMLSQSIQSLIGQEKSLGTIHQNFYSIDDEHSIFDQVFTLFQIQYLPALLVIENSEVMKVTHEPISKMELINHISI